MTSKEILLDLVRMMPTRFSLQHMYAWAPGLSVIRPSNKHPKAKIRQVLQELRDAGLIRFLGFGVYEKSTRRFILPERRLHRV